MNYLLLSGCAGAGILTSNAITTPIYNLKHLTLQQKTPEKIARKLANAGLPFYFKGIKLRLIKSVSKEFLMILFCDGLLLNLSSYLPRFLIAAAAGAVETLISYPQILKNRAIRARIIDHEPMGFESKQDAEDGFLRYLFVKKGFTGLYTGSALYFLTNSVFNSVFYIGFDLTRKLIGFKGAGFFLAPPLVVYTGFSFFGAKIATSFLDLWKDRIMTRVVRRLGYELCGQTGRDTSRADLDLSLGSNGRGLENEADDLEPGKNINFIRELTVVLMDSDSYDLFGKWLEDFWLDAATTGLTLLIYQSLKNKMNL